MSMPYVIGIDGGGSHTRVMLAGLDGRVLAYAEAGGSNPDHNRDAREQVQGATRSAMALGGLEPGAAVGLAAGFSGLDEPEDEVWAREYTDLEGFDGPRTLVNDAVVAHAGALCSETGLVVILGTGSMIYGVTETGRHVRNYDYRHYAPSAARHLGYDAVFRLLAGEASPEDEPLVRRICEYWRVDSVAELHSLGQSGFGPTAASTNRLMGGLAPVVTEAASEGLPLARRVCDAGVETVVTGLRLLLGCFAPPVGAQPALCEGDGVAEGDGAAADYDAAAKDDVETVDDAAANLPVALVGSVARSGYMQQAIARALAALPGSPFRVKEPALSAVAGAVLLALQVAGTPPTEHVRRNLARHPQGRYT